MCRATTASVVLKILSKERQIIPHALRESSHKLVRATLTNVAISFKICGYGKVCVIWVSGISIPRYAKTDTLIHLNN
jgi:hypothetical protein